MDSVTSTPLPTPTNASFRACVVLVQVTWVVCPLVTGWLFYRARRRRELSFFTTLQSPDGRGRFWVPHPSNSLLLWNALNAPLMHVYLASLWQTDLAWRPVQLALGLLMFLSPHIGIIAAAAGSLAAVLAAPSLSSTRTPLWRRPRTSNALLVLLLAAAALLYIWAGVWIATHATASTATATTVRALRAGYLAPLGLVLAGASVQLSVYIALLRTLGRLYQRASDCSAGGTSSDSYQQRRIAIVATQAALCIGASFGLSVGWIWVSADTDRILRNSFPFSVVLVVGALCQAVVLIAYVGCCFVLELSRASAAAGAHAASDLSDAKPTTSTFRAIVLGPEHDPALSFDVALAYTSPLPKV